MSVAWLVPVAFLFRPLLPLHPPVLNGLPYQRDPADVVSVLVLAALTLVLTVGVRGGERSDRRAPPAVLEPA